MDGRIQQRRREVRDAQRRRRLRRSISVAVTLVVLAGLVALERSPLVALEDVQVVGTERLAVDDVLAAADVPLGTSTVRVRLDAITDRVESLPLVHAATVHRADPLTVLIEVEERVPVLVVAGDDGQVLVDREGVVIDTDGHPALATVALDGPAPSVGATVAADDALANAHAVWQGLSGPLRAAVGRYLAGGPDDLTLELTSGVEVDFGRAERMDEKVRALGAVLEDIGTVTVERIDVRAPRAPVVIGE